MSIILIERSDSRELVKNESCVFKYDAWNNDHQDAVDEGALNTQVAATAPTTYDGLRRLSNFEIRQSRNVATVRVNYQKFDTGLKVSLNTSGGTAKRQWSFETIASYPAPGLANAPDFKGLINVDGDRVLGVDEEVRGFNFQVTRRIADTAVDSFIADMYALTKRVNDTEISFSYRGWNPTFEPGELWFRDGDGEPREQTADDSDWEFVLNFSAEPNIEGENVPGLGEIDKQGMDYFWIRHVEDEDALAGVTVRIPEAGYVERTKKRGDLTPLLI